ncbi:MAG TPA: hypothetical protein VK966_09240, partial [Longimicrobiales bacterium]|nr:hypothetical protein [Longimicrobiales bacterium]
ACADAPDSSGAPPEAARTAGDPGNQEDAGQASSERAVTVAPDPETLCDTIRNSFRCARAVEEAALPETPLAERRGDTLLLRLDGDSVRLVDEPGEGDAVHFSFQAHWPEHGYYLVQQQYYEGSAYLLVDDNTGDRTPVPARPLLAPGGDLFAVLSYDLEAGYNPNTLQVWRFTEEGPGLEYETQPDTWGPTNGRWTGPGTLEFTRACPPGAQEGTECGGRATVTSSGEDWILEVNGDD